MMIELHNVTIGQQIRSLSMTVESGQLVCITGRQGSGKTTLLRAMLGLLPVSEGHISIDGELLTPQSAPYFRRMMAYVPQHLSLPEGYDGMGLERWPELTADERYLLLVTNAVKSQKALLIVDEPPCTLSADAALAVDGLLQDASRRGMTVVAVNSRILKKQIQL